MSLAIVSVAIVAGSILAAEPAANTTSRSTQPTKPFDPTDQYDVQQIEGWRVLVSKKFRKSEPAICEKTLKLLTHHLYGVTRVIPPEALGKLRQIAIWVELEEGHHPCMAYHPDPGWLREHGMNPEKGGCVEIANARNFLAWTIDQPVMVLHELAHGYHDRFLDRGYNNPEIKSAYDHAMKAKLYDSVLRCRNRRGRAYAATNPMEYFAETSEAFFGTNDFYPFVRAELHEHDPQMYDLLKKLWGAK
jgi:hypothetical protein